MCLLAAAVLQAVAPSEAMAVFVLSNAFIGLHCALEEFLELLPLARSVAKCISDCPGIARVSTSSS